jgi:hypothetical protein
MTDRLDAIEADLERPEVLNTENGCSVANVGSGDVRWLVGEVRRLRGGIKAWEDKEVHEAMACWKDNEQLKADLTALRERHAEAVEAAWREGALMILDWSFTSEDLNRMWLQSEARKAVARDHGSSAA